MLVSVWRDVCMAWQEETDKTTTCMSCMAAILAVGVIIILCHTDF